MKVIHLFILDLLYSKFSLKLISLIIQKTNNTSFSKINENLKYNYNSL